MCFAKTSSILFYFIPFFPFITRGVVFARYFNLRKVPLTKGQMARESSRTVILALAGFSFAGVIGISVLETTNRQNFKYTVFYLLVSFLGYLAALNLQDYKFFISREQVSNLLTDIATLSLTCSVVSAVFLSGYDCPFQVAVFALALFIWLTDHVIRVCYSWGDFRKIELKQKKEKDHEVQLPRPAEG